jgi:hypothetical protein
VPRHTPLDELKWVHSMVRRDLEVCRELAASVADGASADDVRAGIESLQTNGPLFHLSVNCLEYCMFVHQHHAREDAMMFPAIRQARPDLAPTIDRLEADHRLVSDLLDEVEAAAGDLDDTAGRRRLVDAFTELAEHLTDHLDFEETALAPALDASTI